MSWRFGGIYIRKDFSAGWERFREIFQMKLVLTENYISWSDTLAFSFMGTALGMWNGCTMVHNHLMSYDASYNEKEVYQLDERCQRFSEEGDVMCFYVDGISSSGAFSWYHAGRRVRVYKNISGKLQANSGALLPGENGQAEENEDPEERIMALLGFMVGASFQELLEVDPDMIVCKKIS